MKVCPCGKAFKCHEDTCTNKYNITHCLCPDCLTRHRLAFQGKPHTAILLNECFKGIKQDNPKRKTNTRYDQEADVLYTNFYTPSLEADFTHRIGDFAMRYKDRKLIGITFLNALKHCGVDAVKKNKILLKEYENLRLEMHSIRVDGHRIGTIWDNGDGSVSIRIDPSSDSPYKVSRTLNYPKSTLTVIDQRK